MAFFKFRRAEDSSHPAPAQSIEVLRRRAKHRLIGALVLVGIGVVGFPMLIDKQPRPMSVDLPIDIPDKNKVKPLTAPGASTPAPAIAPASPAPGASASHAAAPPSAAPAAPTPANTEPAKAAVVPAAASLSSQEVIESTPKAKVDTKAEMKAEVKPEAKPDTKPEGDSGARALALLEGKDTTKTESRLVIQIGAFEDSKKVSDIRARLERAGIKTYTQVVDTKDGKRTRVRVGPFESRLEADKAVEKIKKLDLPASILTL